MLDKRKSDIHDILQFDNHFINHLPADPEQKNFRRQVPGACYSKVLPTKVKAPRLGAWSKEAAALLGFNEAFCTSEEFVRIFSGNRVLENMMPYAMCYGGHQFGNWAGQLGDGRAINLGEIKDIRDRLWTLQLKGAGPTPYSRNADGLAVLRSSIREFLCSEAMYHLGIPTTRALSLVTTGEEVERDMFYDGHPKLEPGAIVCRAAPTFLRFGNFEIHAARNEIDVLRQLADYTVSTFFPELGPPSIEAYIRMFEKVCSMTLDMIVDWMRVGFVHGVMNTDNMSILGLTIDYGPYGWLENYDRFWTPNTTDAATRRYSYGNQPGIAQWNLAQLANAIYPLIQNAQPLQQAIEDYGTRYKEKYFRMMARKLGLGPAEYLGYEKLIQTLTELLGAIETDYTIFFRRLADIDLAEFQKNPDNLQPIKDLLAESYYRPEQRTPEYESRLSEWLKAYLRHVLAEGRDASQRKAAMNRVNPKYVLRNYMAQLAIDKAEKGDFSLVEELLELSRRPYDEQPGMEKYAGRRPEWARNRPGCSMLSCSS